AGTNSRAVGRLAIFPLDLTYFRSESHSQGELTGVARTVHDVRQRASIEDEAFPLAHQKFGLRVQHDDSDIARAAFAGAIEILEYPFHHLSSEGVEKINHQVSLGKLVIDG